MVTGRWCRATHLREGPVEEGRLVVGLRILAQDRGQRATEPVAGLVDRTNLGIDAEVHRRERDLDIVIEGIRDAVRELEGVAVAAAGDLERDVEPQVFAVAELQG